MVNGIPFSLSLFFSYIFLYHIEFETSALEYIFIQLFLVREAVRLKKEAFRDLLSRGTPEAVERYRKARRAAASAVAEAKQRVWEKFREDMEKDFRTAPKLFWKTVRHLRRGKQGTIQAVYSKDGMLLTSTEGVGRNTLRNS